MTTIIDIGNTTVKIGQLNSANQITGFTRYNISEFDQNAVLNPPPATSVIIGRSGPQQTLNAILTHLKKTDTPTHILDKETHLPFSSNYAPGQAGIDRLANVAAAIQLSAGAAIIIDAGSAITIEAVSHNHIFLGGAILPGLHLQAKALHHNTAELPSINPFDPPDSPIGTNTKAAIQSGIIHGIAGGIQRLIHTTTQQPGMANPTLIITGGDGPLLAQCLSLIHLTLIPELTLLGLAAISQNQN